MMKKMSTFFEFMDRFNFPISFGYKKDDSYSTCLGGIVSFLLALATIVFGFYYFIPFCERKNYSLYYYTINLDQTQEINLYKSKASLAFNFDCSKGNKLADYGNLGIKDFIDLNVNFIYYKNASNETAIENNKNGTKKNKTYLPIDFDNCTDSDFYNNENLLKNINFSISNLICLKDLNHTIKNRHQDKHDNFTYFQIDLKARNDTDYSIVRNYLLDYDCKFELYYIDVKVEVDDYENPIKPFLNKVFLQLNPDFVVKMDAYYMNEYFESINQLFFQKEKKEDDKPSNLFSRTEQYFLYKGIDSREESFAQIFIRADTRKMEIKRKYQTIMEFFADNFSFWGDIFLICQLIFYIYNRISLIYYLETELFIFKGEKNKYFDISRNSKSINDLINKIDNKYLLNKSQIIVLNNNKYNTKNPISIKTNINNQKNLNKSFGEETDDRIVPKRAKKHNKINKNYIKKKAKYICMKLLNLFKCKCCKCEQTPREIQSSKAEKIIKKKLNIIYYLKNMMLLDVFNNRINEDKKEIFKFLSLPIISPNLDEKDNEESFPNFAKHFTNDDFNIFSDKINKLLESDNINDKKLILISNDNLKKTID